MSKHILIVDDDTSTLKALSRLLQRDGYEVDVCDAPHQALARIRDAAPDVLLTDQMMGAMTGLELARRTLAEHPSARCIVMSGHGPPAAEDCAHVTWIQKPFSIDLLVSTIEAAE